MSTSFDSLRNRFASMSKPLQVGLIIVSAILLFIFIHDFVWDIADGPNGWNDQSTRLEKVIADSRRHLKEISPESKRLVKVFGPVEEPGSESTGSQKLAATVNEIMKAQEAKVTNFTYKAQEGPKLPREALAGLGNFQGRYDRLRAEVKFDASTDVVAAVIAALESSPEIESINSLRVVRHDIAPRVTVNLTVEAWVKSSTVDRRRGGGNV